MITRTPTGHEVSEEVLSARFALVREVKDFRLEQLSKDSYRALILPDPDSDRRGIKGSVLDALVDVYGMNARYDIDIIEEDEELLPRTCEKAIVTCE
ncbi:MAG: hypothetical protein IJT58_03905 [Synergistaceae bacterium]|nr:hypothetical protein [Synergistaceae bacterium]